MNKKIKIFGFGGSLRKESYSFMLLKNAAKLVPDDVEIRLFEPSKLEAIPNFNQDKETSPEPALIEFKNEIKAADALLISTPEYNYSVPGYLKNAIDCASRPYTDNAFLNKPVALMSVSSGMLGGVKAQFSLRQSFVFLQMPAVNKPEILISNAGEKFDSKGDLKDEKTKQLITELLKNLSNLTRKLKTDS